VEELELRQAIREGQHSVGFESILSTFGMPLHSHPLLQDVELPRKIQVHIMSMSRLDVSILEGSLCLLLNKCHPGSAPALLTC